MVPLAAPPHAHQVTHVISTTVAEGLRLPVSAMPLPEARIFVVHLWYPKTLCQCIWHDCSVAGWLQRPCRQELPYSGVIGWPALSGLPRFVLPRALPWQPSGLWLRSPLALRGAWLASRWNPTRSSRDRGGDEHLYCTYPWLFDRRYTDPTSFSAEIARFVYFIIVHLMTYLVRDERLIVDALLYYTQKEAYYVQYFEAD